MTDALKARDAKDVEDAVRWALAEGKTLGGRGPRFKRALGRPSQSDLTLDLSGLSGVTLYEPEELVLSAKAGTPLAEIEALVESKGQQLAFEPMDYGPILGGPADAGSLGGALAANLSGPRRIKAGAARDHFLGFSAVSGRAETFKSGGRVVKNVTGYDLFASHGRIRRHACRHDRGHHRRAGDRGDRAGARPRRRGANAAMSAAMASSCDVSAAAHLPRQSVMHFRRPLVAKAATAFRLEGFAPSVRTAPRCADALLRRSDRRRPLDRAHSRKLWRSVRDAAPFWANGSAGDWPLWRVSTTPARGAELPTSRARRAVVLRLGRRPDLDRAAAVAQRRRRSIRRAAAATGGHATLVRASVATRAAVDVFEPQQGALAGVTRRVKESFDPKGVLNPGRMWAGV